MQIGQVERQLLANTRIEIRTVARCWVVAGGGVLAAELAVFDDLAGSGSRTLIPVGVGDGVVVEPLPGSGGGS